MKVLNDLTITRLCDVVDTTAIYYDPKSTKQYTTNITQHKEMMELYSELIELSGDSDDTERSPWVLHMSVDRVKMYASRVSMHDIRYAIENAMNTSSTGSIVSVLVADDNSDDLVVRIQVLGGSTEGADAVDSLKTVEKTIMDNVVIRGIPGIKSASMHKKETMVKKDGDYVKMDRWVIDTEGVNL